MALELLAGPFDCAPVIDRNVVTGTTDTTYPASGMGAGMLIEGRGVLTEAGGLRRFLVQPDGAFAQLGGARFSNSTTVLAWSETTDRWYAEYERSVTGGRVRLLHPITLMGWEDIGAAPASTPSSAALLPDGTWISTGFSDAVQRYRDGAWTVDAHVPIVAGLYLSWAEDPEEVWLANASGDCLRYNWRARAATTGILRTHVNCTGMWYWRKHRVLMSLHAESGLRRVRVWATTPLPAALVQTVTPAPTAGRVSRVRTRLLGSDAEPCVGEVVSWSVPSGYQLVPLQPVTDDSGYALADLIVPMGMAGDGSVTASVVI